MKLNKVKLRNLIAEELEQKISNGELSREQLEEIFGIGKAAKAVGAGVSKLAGQAAGAVGGAAKKVGGALGLTKDWAGMADDETQDLQQKTTQKMKTILNRKVVAAGITELSSEISALKSTQQVVAVATVMKRLGLGAGWFKTYQSQLRGVLSSDEKTSGGNVDAKADARFKTGTRGGAKSKGGAEQNIDDVFLEDNKLEHALQEIIRNELTNLINKPKN